MTTIHMTTDDAENIIVRREDAESNGIAHTFGAKDLLPEQREWLEQHMFNAIVEMTPKYIEVARSLKPIAPTTGDSVVAGIATEDVKKGQAVSYVTHGTVRTPRYLGSQGGE